MMKVLLRSPFHGLTSRSVLILYFRGRITGKRFSTPLRYETLGPETKNIDEFDNETVIELFTSKDTQWHKNFDDPQQVGVHIQGTTFQGSCVRNNADPAEIERSLMRYLTKFPQDAPYHQVRIQGGKLNEDDVKATLSSRRIVRVTDLARATGPIDSE